MRELDIKGIGMTSQRTRNRLVKTIEQLGVKDKKVLRVMRLIPRHLFMDEALASRSYENTALPIGHGQTISQPYIVARMTELLLEAQPCLEKVLEVGTGSAYQAAVLGGLVRHLDTVERIFPLYAQARTLLYDLGYRNVQVHYADGTWGWAKGAPYDAIIVTAAPANIPTALIEQLKIGGRMVIPVGQPQRTQRLQLVTRISEHSHTIKNYESVVFVPFLKSKQ
ncbi:MAG: protein-L-isoaspartate(D-aspartate) O-methyltransferase [Cocleimonas sp.]|nr:protein-L-isoaspartate(D-aspartate) O-methyltransferase [Cocleimonas sp.]